MTDNATVALLGTGIMGAGMGRNLLAAGLPLRVWIRTPEKARPLGEAVHGADVIVTMLGDGHHVRAVMEQALDGRGESGRGPVWAQMTTAGVDQGALLALAERHGLRFVDAPVVGTRRPAEQGTPLVLAAGAPEVRDAVAPVFDAVGGGPLDLPYLQAKAAAIRAQDWTPNFSVSGAAKDADLIVAAATAGGVRVDVAEGAAARFHRAADAGHGDADMAANHLAS